MSVTKYETPKKEFKHPCPSQDIEDERKWELTLKRRRRRLRRRRRRPTTVVGDRMSTSAFEGFFRSGSGPFLTDFGKTSTNQRRSFLSLRIFFSTKFFCLSEFFFFAQKFRNLIPLHFLSLSSSPGSTSCQPEILAKEVDSSSSTSVTTLARMMPMLFTMLAARRQRWWCWQSWLRRRRCRWQWRFWRRWRRRRRRRRRWWRWGRWRRWRRWSKRTGPQAWGHQRDRRTGDVFLFLLFFCN